MTNTYTDSITYLKQPTGLQLSNYVGISARLQAQVAQGATSLSIPNTMTLALNTYDPVYVCDGPSSEIVQAGAYVAPGATSIPLLAGTAYGHNAGTPFCTDGVSGSLGEQIFTASRRIEDEICFQALWSTTYTSEVLTMPTMRAALDNQNNIHFRPRHFPITALSAMSIKTTQLASTSYDTTQAIIDADQQTVDIPLLAALSTNGQPAQGSPWMWPALSRQINAWITITYTSGFAAGTLPKAVEQACGLLVSDAFVPLQNPIGADSIKQGDQMATFMIRGDVSGESVLFKRVRKMLQPYTMESF
jgi:hypothetical protein